MRGGLLEVLSYRVDIGTQLLVLATRTVPRDLNFPQGPFSWLRLHRQQRHHLRAATSKTGAVSGAVFLLFAVGFVITEMECRHKLCD